MWRQSMAGMGWCRRAARAVAVGLGLMLAVPAAAQDAALGQQSAAPIIDRDRTDRLEPQIAPPPVAAPRPAPSVQVAPAASSAAQTLLTRLIYSGTTLPGSRLDAATSPFIGRPLTGETLQAIAHAISATYAKSDIAFYSVSIPPQLPGGGVLTVHLVEGRVRDYRLAGMSPSMPVGLIAAHMRRLMRDAPLRKSRLERTLALLRDIPGQTVDARLRQSGAPGDLLIDLIVKRKQVQIGLTIDNSGVSNVVQGVQAQMSVTVNGLAREGDSTRIAGYLPFYPDRYQYYSLSHSTPIGSNGLTLAAQAAHVETRSRDSRTTGEATLAGLTLSYPVLRSTKSQLSVTASVDGIDSDNYFLDIRFGDYRSRALRLGASWSRADARNGYAVSTVVSQGIDALGARPFTGFSETGFTKVNVQAIAVKGISGKLSLRTSVKGQYSKDDLPVTERFPLGGRGAGMAFRTGTLTAEQALAGSAELSWSLPARSPVLKASALFVALDGALAHGTARPAYRLAARDYSLASAGGGLRLGLGAKWRVSAEVAVPVKRPDPTLSRKARFFFGVGRAF
ncbi:MULTISPECIES: ShlB/FhaC/HecB family hemolysin secretion/activation protein [unclassified Sphingobium]|uniref:ShlB/FhaC/HecB family hemolysin secretion/activation protein n=1 Tax=unclassified Sphingobium TaxID=2611147 RepID=UPI001EF0DE38|nr:MULTISPECIES: ShlB/FhaC/HecB family hemolysin secretion/activation protein [unclassified Sphingobium]